MVLVLAANALSPYRLLKVNGVALILLMCNLENIWGVPRGGTPTYPKTNLDVESRTPRNNFHVLQEWSNLRETSSAKVRSPVSFEWILLHSTSTAKNEISTDTSQQDGNLYTPFHLWIHLIELHCVTLHHQHLHGRDGDASA